MSHNDRFAHTPEKRAGKEPDPARHAISGQSAQDSLARSQGFNQETDKTYGGGRWGQRTPKTAHGGLSHGETPDHNEQGHGRDYNEGSNEQRFISKTPDAAVADKRSQK